MEQDMPYQYDFEDDYEYQLHILGGFPYQSRLEMSKLSLSIDSYAYSEELILHQAQGQSQPQAHQNTSQRSQMDGLSPAHYSYAQGNQQGLRDNHDVEIEPNTLNHTLINVVEPQAQPINPDDRRLDNNEHKKFITDLIKVIRKYDPDFMKKINAHRRMTNFTFPKGSRYAFLILLFEILYIGGQEDLKKIEQRFSAQLQELYGEELQAYTAEEEFMRSWYRSYLKCYALMIEGQTYKSLRAIYENQDFKQKTNFQKGFKKVTNYKKKLEQMTR